MDNSNIKVYLGISFALIVLLILIVVIPFSNKKSSTSTLQPTPYNLQPTTVETYSLQPTPYNLSSIPADFTGVAEEELPPQILDTALQKKDLRQKTPLDLSTFTIDFNYSEDKFVVTLVDPKDQAQKEFEGWRTANYPGLGSEQFVVRWYEWRKQC